MESIISIRSLFKNYGKKQVLKDINLEIAPGQVIGYIGPNGAGKSTTVKILCGLLPSFSGEVKIMGLDVKKQSLEIKQSIGYIPEIAEMYDLLTPREFLHLVGTLYGLKETLINSRSESLLEIFSMAENMDQRMDTFSKGMKQKVLITSGLLHNPEIIFFDEPLSGLDANSVFIVKDMISKLAESGKTIFYCSHIMDIVEKISDRIILINDGQVIADGTFEDLKQMQGENSLEKIFTNLTSNISLNELSDKFINVLNNDK
ncbi:MAG: ABC transporter ATP-binding protein [Deltaproteobacteria bacterium]